MTETIIMEGREKHVNKHLDRNEGTIRSKISDKGGRKWKVGVDTKLTCTVVSLYNELLLT